MATYTFKWPHRAEEVYVTGTFDSWTKSEQLEKVGDVFQKTVKIPDGSKKVHYKFVVDNEWVTDPEAPQETDNQGILNNFLLPADMSKPEDARPTAAILNTVTPESTTAQLAGAVPVEAAKDEAAAPAVGITDTVTPESTTAALAGAVPMEETKSQATAPGGYPETPATDLDKELKVSPLPAADGAVNPIQLAPGEKIPDKVTAGDIKDNVTLDKESYEQSDRIPGAAAINAAATEGSISVNPLPAAPGALNPIKLAPGEKIPEGVTTGNITDNVTLDKESYEKSDRIPGLETQLPPITSNMIPESSLPILGAGDVTINTVTPESTTAALAGRVPIEPKVPEIVKKSQEEAHADPEASGISEEVREKAAVEEELLKVVPEAPSTAEGTGGKGTDKSEGDKALTQTVAAAGVKESATAATAAALEEPKPAAVEAAEEAPAPVKQSIVASGESPEAAANAVAVEEKREVEAELLKKVEEVTPAAEAEPSTKAEEPKAEEAPKVEEAPKAAPVKPAAAPAETNGAKAVAPEAVPAVPATAPTATAETTKAADGAATVDKKKKHRLSAMLSKLKHKVTGDRK